MRLNRYVALATGLSRRAADAAIAEQRVYINEQLAKPGQEVIANDTVTLDGQPLKLAETTTVMLNKPVGYVCSRNGQGNKTVYDLLPTELHHLKPVGRLDKDSSGLLLLTNDGELAQQLTHPSFKKEKAYEILLDKPLSDDDKANIERGIKLEEGMSVLKLKGNGRSWTVSMSEGRNRQIRRTFAALGYTVTKLHRTQFGPYALTDLAVGHYKQI
jgi:23S rRNA pseudouridine2605 synthase